MPYTISRLQDSNSAWSVEGYISLTDMLDLVEAIFTAAEQNNYRRLLTDFRLCFFNLTDSELI